MQKKHSELSSNPKWIPGIVTQVSVPVMETLLATSGKKDVTLRNYLLGTLFPE